jgi:hypothetical protein
MPRGEHFRKDVENSKILDQFDRDDLDRKMYTTSEIANGVPELTEGAVRNRMRSMDQIDSEKFGNTKFWFRDGVDPFADGGQHSSPLFESRARALKSVFGAEATGERRLKVLRDFMLIGFRGTAKLVVAAGIVEVFTTLQGVAGPLAIIPGVFAGLWLLAIVLNPDDSLRSHVSYRLRVARDTRDDLFGGEATDE